MNYWKPIGIVASCAALGLAGVLVWQQYGPALTMTDAGEIGSSAPQSSQQTKEGDGQRGRGGSRGGGRPPALVVVQPVVEAVINDRLKAVGSGKAKASVSVVPLSSGLLDDLLVTSGQYVEKGAVLARLDNAEQQIAHDRAVQYADKAAVDETRVAKLFNSNTISESELVEARNELIDARLSMRDTALTLKRRNITAPIAGVVGLIAVNEGNYVTPQTEIATIDDRSTVVLEFWVPERFSNQVAKDQSIQATSQANPARVHNGTITGIGSRVETDSRTLPVQAALNNEDDSLRPGMAFNIDLSFTGQSYPAVNPLAIQWDSKGSYVWAVEDSKVKRIAVQIIQRNPESVLVAGEIAAGAQVVTEGLLALRPGASVRVQGSDREGNNRPDKDNQGKDNQGKKGTARAGSVQPTASARADKQGENGNNEANPSEQSSEPSNEPSSEKSSELTVNKPKARP